MFVQVVLGYSCAKKIVDLSDEAYENLRSQYPDVFPKDKDRVLSTLGYGEGEIVTLEDAQRLLDAGYEVQVKRFRSLVPKPPKEVEAAKQAQNVFYLHIPNFSLLNITEVDYLEDSCTEVLSAKLKSGWRIVAVCPPLDQRRPTYIIGRGAGAGL